MSSEPDFEDVPYEEPEQTYTLTVDEFRQVSYAIASLNALLFECHIPIQSAFKAQSAQAHANEALKMLHEKNP